MVSGDTEEFRASFISHSGTTYGSTGSAYGKTTDAGRCQISSEILNARQLEKVFNMPRPGKMHKGNFPMKHGKMGKLGKMPAPGCPNACACSGMSQCMSGMSSGS